MSSRSRVQARLYATLPHTGRAFDILTVGRHRWPSRPVSTFPRDCTEFYLTSFISFTTRLLLFRPATWAAMTSTHANGFCGCGPRIKSPSHGPSFLRCSSSRFIHYYIVSLRGVHERPPPPSRRSRCRHRGSCSRVLVVWELPCAQEIHCEFCPFKADMVTVSPSTKPSLCTLRSEICAGRHHDLR